MGGGGRLISGWAYIQNNIFVGKWMGLYLGGGLKVGFYGIIIVIWNLQTGSHKNMFKKIITSFKRTQSFKNVHLGINHLV